MSSGLSQIGLATPKTIESTLNSVILEILFYTPYHLLCQWGLILDLNGIENVTIHLSDPENYRIDTKLGHFGHIIFHPYHPPCQWGLNLDLNDIGSVTIHLSDPENCGFDTNIGRFQLLLHVTLIKPLHPISTLRG